MSANDNLDFPSDSDVNEQISRTNELPEVVVEEQRVERIVKEAAIQAAILVRRESFSGPLPKPEHLKAYEEICPGAAQDILNEFKANGQHVRDCEKRALNASVWKVTRGQTIAALLAVLCLIFAFICTINYEAYWVAGAFITLTGTLVLPFLGFNPKSKNKKDESEEV